MVKITINGETFSFDNDRYPLPEAIDLEEKLKIPFAAWKTGLYTGSAKSLAGFAYLVLKRNGRDVPLEDILSGAYDLAWEDVNGEQEGGEDPTGPPSPEGDGSTSEPSPSGSASGRGSGSTSRSRK